jgi:Ulp1 protease family, C-terminal catalytic domain
MYMCINSFHWILLYIEIDKSRVVVFDSKRKPTAAYQDLINLLQTAWARFLKKHIGVSDKPGELTFKTDIPVCVCVCIYM